MPPDRRSLTINGGALTTTSAAVRLDVAATNADGSHAWAAHELFQRCGDLERLAGLCALDTLAAHGWRWDKDSRRRFKNSAGAISAIVSDTITLDTGVQAEYSVTINHGALYTNKVAVQLTISARPHTAEMQVSNDGGFIGVTWEPYSAHKAWEITRYRDQEITGWCIYASAMPMATCRRCIWMTSS